MEEKSMTSASEIFKFYFGELKDIYSGYMGFEVTMSLAIITIISWFLTSAEAKKIIANSKTIRRYSLAAIILTSMAEFYVVYLVYCNSTKIGSIVKVAATTLYPVDPEKYYRYRILDLGTLTIFYAFHLLLLIVLSRILLTIEPEKEADVISSTTEAPQRQNS